jgi:hypothetical protein
MMMPIIVSAARILFAFKLSIANPKFSRNNLKPPWRPPQTMLGRTITLLGDENLFMEAALSGCLLSGA